MKVQPIILAAGKGTRMGNPELPKVLFPLAGQPMIVHLLRTLNSCSFMAASIVVGYRQELVREALGGDYSYVVQREQLGTGHAIKVCQEALQGTAEAYLVLYGDQPLWSADTLQRLIASHEASGAVLTLGTVVTDHQSFKDFGRIIRDSEGVVVASRENKDCTEEDRLITEYNPSLYCFSDSWLWDALSEITPANTQGEYYLPDLISIALKNNLAINTYVVPDWQETLGVNTPEQLAVVEGVLALRN